MVLEKLAKEQFDFGVGYNMNDLGLWLNYQPAVTNTVANTDVDGEAAVILVQLMI